MFYFFSPIHFNIVCFLEHLLFFVCLFFSEGNDTLTCLVQLSSARIRSSIKAFVALKVDVSVNNTLWSAQSCVNTFENEWRVYDLQCSFASLFDPKRWSDNGEKPCITSRSHCLHVYSHSVEQNTFYLPDRHRKHTLIICSFWLLSLWISISVFSDLYWLFFFYEKLVSLYAFYGLQNAAYNNVFNINVQDFCGSMTVCFVFFCTANVDKRGGGN